MISAKTPFLVREKFFTFLLLISILCMGPFYFNILVPELKIIAAFSVLVMVSLLLTIKSIKYNEMIVNIILIEMASLLVLSSIHQDFSYFKTVFSSHVYLLLVYIFIKTFLNSEKVIRLFLILVVIMSMLSFFTFLLIFFGVHLPFTEDIANDGRVLYNFYTTFTVAYYPNVNIMRPGGYFDEPGMMAFILVLALILNDLTIQNKLFKVIFIITGLSTLSIAFMIIVTIYLIISSSFFSKIKYLFLFFFIIVVMNIFFHNTYMFKVLTHYTIDRILTPSNGAGLSEGDNRTPELLKSLSILENNPNKLLFGLGYTNVKDKYKNTLSSNPMAPILTNGLFGLVLFLHFFVIIIFPIKGAMINYKINKEHVAISIALLLLLLQRPSPFGIFTMLLSLFVVENLYKKIKYGVRYENSN